MTARLHHFPGLFDCRDIPVVGVPIDVAMSHSLIMGVPTSVTIVGSTGLTGSAALSSLLSSPTPVSITALTRREIVPSKTPAAGTTLTTRILADLSQAATDSQPLSSGGGTYISCLGTKLAVVGDVKKQEQIDLVLNRNLAQRAKSDGAETVRRNRAWLT